MSIKISRSGNGAHAWIFFSEKIQANIARKLGSGLITFAMNKRSELMYISRSAIPSLKKKKFKRPKFFKQVCIYGFNKSDLNLFSRFKKKTFLENYEDIEILRFLENGKIVKMIKLNSKSYAVDTYSDIQKVENIIKRFNK